MASLQNIDDFILMLSLFWRIKISIFWLSDFDKIGVQFYQLCLI
jgi:hypothetical protein